MVKFRAHVHICSYSLHIQVYIRRMCQMSVKLFLQLLMYQILGGVESWFSRNMYNQRYSTVNISEEVEAVMNRVDRANYVPARCHRPYADKFQRIGFGSAISAPHLVRVELSVNYLNGEIRTVDT